MGTDKKVWSSFAFKTIYFTGINGMYSSNSWNQICKYACTFMEALNRNEHKPQLITLRFLKNVMQANLKTNVTRTQTMSNFPKKLIFLIPWYALCLFSCYLLFCFLFTSCYLRFEIRPFALLSTICSLQKETNEIHLPVIEKFYKVPK